MTTAQSDLKFSLIDEAVRAIADSQGDRLANPYEIIAICTKANVQADGRKWWMIELHMKLRSQVQNPF